MFRLFVYEGQYITLSSNVLDVWSLIAKRLPYFPKRLPYFPNRRLNSAVSAGTS